MLFFILALVITDMVIKTIIYFNFMDLNVTFFNDYLGFTPILTKIKCLYLILLLI